MASSGSFATTSCEGRSLTFSWSIQSQSIENNTTTIAWNLKGSGSYSGYVICGGFQVVINGSTVCNNSTDYRLNVYSGTVVASGTHTIYHNNDGTKSFSASASAGIYYYDRNCSGSGSWSLDSIPRSSAFGTISGNTIGSSMTVNISRNSSSFTHQLWYKLGNSSWYDVGSGVGTQKTFTVSNDLLSQLPSATSGTLQLRLRTYNGSTQIGSDVYKNITVYVASSVVPKVGTITLTPQTYKYLIQNKNKLTVSISGCSAGAGSGIKSYTFSGPGISTTVASTSGSASVTSGVVSNAGTVTYTITVTDNRGRTASTTKSYTCYAYSAPKITLSAYRVASSSSTDANSNGTWVRCTYSLSYSSVDGSNKPAVKIYYKKNTSTGNFSSVSTSIGSTTSGSNGVMNATGNYTLSSISVNDAYTIYADITDSYGGSTSSFQVTVFGAERILNIRPDGNGMALGKMAGTDDATKNLLDSKWAIRSDEPAKSMQNLSYRGFNLISDISHDTTDDWVSQGNLATTLYNKTGQINGQPSQYGFLLNITNNRADVHQLWMQQSNGSLYHRGGNQNGISSTWKTVLDSTNYTNYVTTKPTTLFSSSSGTVGTITLSDSATNYTYLEIFYTDNNGRQPNSVKIYSPNGKYVSLSCIEPSTNGDEPRIYIRSSGWTISDTSMIIGRSDLSNLNAGVYGQIYPHADGTNIDVKITPNIYIKIFRVLGYK